MNSFVGEFLVLVGTFLWDKLTATLAALGIILAAVYILYMLQRIIYGTQSEHMAPKLHDLNWREFGMLVPLVIFVFWIGLHPKTCVGCHARQRRPLAPKRT